MTETVTIKFEGQLLDVRGEYYEGTPALYNYSNGDPGYPEEPPSFEIESISFQGKDITSIIEACNSYVNRCMKGLAQLGDLFIEIENLCIKELTN